MSYWKVSQTKLGWWHAVLTLRSPLYMPPCLTDPLPAWAPGEGTLSVGRLTNMAMQNRFRTGPFSQKPNFPLFFLITWSKLSLFFYRVHKLYRSHCQENQSTKPFILLMVQHQFNEPQLRLSNPTSFRLWILFSELQQVASASCRQEIMQNYHKCSFYSCLLISQNKKIESRIYVNCVRIEKKNIWVNNQIEQ